MTILLKDAPFGVRVFTKDGMGSEVRVTVYKRRKGSTRYPNNVAIYSHGCVQGEPGTKARYRRIQPKGYPSEAHGMLPVCLLADLPADVRRLLR